jgi:hypothetical protein
MTPIKSGWAKYQLRSGTGPGRTHSYLTTDVSPFVFQLWLFMVREKGVTCIRNGH